MTTHTSRATIRELIATLVQIETENPPGNERACSEFILNWFDDHDIDADTIIEPDPDRPQVGVRIGDDEPTLVLNGHIDVVPAGDRDNWSYDPYGGTVDGTRLYGRGSADMKSGVAIGMLATVRLAQAIRDGDLDGSIVFHAAMGEETAEPGTKTLLDAGYDGTYGVVLEPTGMRTATAEKGLAWYEINVSGEPSHASHPDQGDNAVYNARPILDAIEEYDATVRDRTDDLLGRAYATVTEVKAGTKENVVPGTTTITVDRRFLPDEQVSAIDQEIETMLTEATVGTDVEATWRRTRTYESAAIDPASHLAAVFRRQSAAVADVPTEPWGIAASTDVRNFVNDAGMEAITWGPAELSQAHTYDEHVDLAAIEDGLEALVAASRELLGGDDV